jgi:hypothetical protein
VRLSPRILLAGLLFVLCTGCKLTTAEYMQKQRGYRVVSGHVYKLSGLDEPEVTKLKNGTAYLVTQEGATVEMYFDKRHPRTRQRIRRTFELLPGDQFINSQPFSHVLIKQ